MKQHHFLLHTTYAMVLAILSISIACVHEKNGNVNRTLAEGVSRAENEITEITIERSQCRGNCPAYRASFYQNGEAMYWGISNMTRLGRYHATGKDCSKCYYDKMAKLLILNGFLNL